MALHNVHVPNEKGREFYRRNYKWNTNEIIILYLFKYDPQ